MMHRSGKSWKTWGMVLAIALAVVSMGPPAWAGKADDTLNIAWQKELPTLDRYYNTAREGMIISRHICDDLLYRDPNTNAYEPLLAKSYQWVDNKTLDFVLRKGIVFQNGQKFSADDVVYTLNYMSNPDNKVLVQRNVDWIDHVEKLGPYKVRIHLKKPFPAALEYVAGNLPIYPHIYYAKVGPKGFGIKPIGTGPYKVVEVVPGKKIVMVKNTHYFKDSPKGQPAIGRIVQRTIPELTTIMAELVTGKLDWAYLIPNDQAKQLASVPNLKVLRAETMRIGFLEMDARGKSADSGKPQT
jgi:peptide/nickel transport system substrate-binding protein